MYARMENSLYQLGKCLSHSQASLVLEKMVYEADRIQVSEASYPAASISIPTDLFLNLALEPKEWRMLGRILS